MSDGRISRRSLLSQTLVGSAALATVAGCADGSDGPDKNQAETDTGKGGQVPEPIAMIRTSWSIDPFALGSYSYMAVGATPEMRAVLAAPLSDSTSANRVFFAGEATAADNPATVHGAQESGRRVAAEVQSAAGAGERIVVIGAGAAGITAGRLLTDDGFEVLVVEARDRMGGRLHTVTAGDDILLELGASWVHDLSASDLAEQLAEIGVAVAAFDYDSQVVLGTDGVRMQDADSFIDPATQALAGAIEWAEEQDVDLSVAEALSSSGAAEGVDSSALVYLDDSEIATEYGASASELSAWWGFEEGSEGDDVIVLGGYDALVRTTADGLTVELQRPVARIEWGATGVLVVDASGNEVAADRVVITVPLGVLKSGSIEFEPPLSDEKLEVIESIGFGVLDKVWFIFDEVFWTERSLMWNIVAEEGTPYCEWFNLQPVTGKPVLLSLVGGTVAHQWSQRSDAEVKAAALTQLQQFIDAGW